MKNQFNGILATLVFKNLSGFLLFDYLHGTGICHIA